MENAGENDPRVINVLWVVLKLKCRGIECRKSKLCLQVLV
jgi:hypothetical protein